MSALRGQLAEDAELSEELGRVHGCVEHPGARRRDRADLDPARRQEEHLVGVVALVTQVRPSAVRVQDAGLCQRRNLGLGDALQDRARCHRDIDIRVRSLLAPHGHLPMSAVPIRDGRYPSGSGRATHEGPGEPGPSGEACEIRRNRASDLLSVGEAGALPWVRPVRLPWVRPVRLPWVRPVRLPWVRPVRLPWLSWCAPRPWALRAPAAGSDFSGAFGWIFFFSAIVLPSCLLGPGARCLGASSPAAGDGVSPPGSPGRACRSSPPACVTSVTYRARGVRSGRDVACRRRRTARPRPRASGSSRGPEQLEHERLRLRVILADAPAAEPADPHRGASTVPAVHRSSLLSVFQVRSVCEPQRCRG